MFYIYRATTDKLGDALNRITANGDTVRDVVHVGGRDWVIICRQGVDPSFAEALRVQRHELRAAKAERDRISGIVDRAAESRA